MQVVSYELWVVILRKQIYELGVPFYEFQSNFTSCKFILWVGNKITSYKLLFASCKLLFTSCKFKEIILRLASCVLGAENLKKYFTSCQLLFMSLKFKMKKITSWKFKMIMFTSCEVAFYKLNIYDANFTNYHHMVESSFKRINLRKLCRKAILIKCTLMLDNLNTHYSNPIETVIRTFDLSNSSCYRNSLTILYNNCFMYHNDHLVSFIVWVIKSMF